MPLPIPILALLVLASYRLSRIAVEDTVFDRPRSAIVRWADRRRWTQFIGGILSCTWCGGWWISVTLYAVWAATAGSGNHANVEHIAAAAAVAGGQGLLSSWEGET